MAGEAAAVAGKTDVSGNWHVLVGSWLGELFDGMDASIFVLVLYPALSELLKTTSHEEVGQVGSVVLAVFMVGWAVGAVAFGMLADRIGRTRTMVITILLYAICTGLCALSRDWVELAFYRFLVGCGIGGEISIGAVMVSECWRGRSRLHAVAFLSTSFGCGYLAAALINLWVGPMGWRWLFLAGVVPALVTVYIRAKIKEPAQFKQVHALRQAIGRKPADERTASEARLVSSTFARLFEPAVRGRVLVVIGLASAAIIGYWAVLSWIPAWVNQLTGHNAVTERSVTAIVMNVGAIAAAAMGGFILSRLGRVAAFRIAFGGALATCLGMFLTVKSFGVALFAWVFLAGGFATLPFVLLFTYVPELFETDIRSTAFGFSVQAGRLFAACAALAGGQIIHAFAGSYATAGACVSLVYVVGLLATRYMPQTTGEAELTADVARLSLELQGGKSLVAGQAG